MNEKQKDENLKNKAISSTGWGFLDKGIGFVVQFIIGIILARLLPPSDFGLIGLAMIVVGFGQIFVKLGLGPALIQKQEITSRHIRVVLTTSLIAGLILGCIVFYTAPFFAWVLESEKVIPIIQALSVLFIIAGLQIPSEALLNKELHFKQLFYVNLVKSLSYGFITIIFALMDYGVWSLVIGNIISQSTNFVGNYIFTRHSLKPLLSKKEFHDLIHFGSGETLSGIFSFFALQGDYFIVGKILGSESLGLYTKAYNLMMAPTTHFISVLTNILFPTASKFQHDKERTGKVFLKSMTVISFITIPLCVLIAIIAPDLIIGLYGSKWEGAIIPLQILASFGVFRAMYNASASFLKAKGWVFKIFWAQVAYGTLILISVWLAAENYGLSGASWAVGFSILIMWGIMMELNVSLTGISRGKVVGSLLPGLILGTVMLLGMELLLFVMEPWQLSPIIRLGVEVIIGIAIGITAAVIMPQKWLKNIPAELIGSIIGMMPHSIRGHLGIVLNYLSK